jgi:type IV pilus assembly protein PilB
MPKKRERRAKKLSAFLVERGLITGNQLDKAVFLAEETGKKLIDVIEEQGYANREELLKAMGETVNMPYIKLNINLIDPNAVKLIPAKVARRYKAMPILVVANILTIAVSDPFDLLSLDYLRFASGYSLEPVLADERDIERAIEHFIGKEITPEVITTTTGEEEIEYLVIPDEKVADIAKSADAPPVVKLVNLFLTQAIRQNASDIHIELESEMTRVRYRVDGYLREAHLIEKKLGTSTISRIKILANLDITEHRLPQDGRFFIRFEDRDIDFRVATTPTIYGETAIIRVLDQSKAKVTLDDLGLDPPEYERIRRNIKKPAGFILVTGPTGSGKTTTLYAILNELNSMTKKIITLEDPVEYRLNIVNQIPINPKVNLDFARGLRSLLRQDPDIILVGEIRDKETAEVAVQAALTGHLLLSTLHTMGTAETVGRLLDIGIERYYIKEVTECIVAQRLVRKLCPDCKERYIPSKKLLSQISLRDKGEKEIIFFRPRGCSTCNGEGYKGRIGIFELMEITEELRDLIYEDAGVKELRKKAVSQGMRTMWEVALEKVASGLTSVEEITGIIPRI